MPTRDRRLDSLRGLLLVIMTIDHLGGSLSHFTYEPFGFVSAAAAFVLLSGYMYAYTSQRAAASLYSLLIQATKRALRIYKYQAIILIALLIVAVFSPIHAGYWGKKLFVADGTPLSTLTDGLLLLHQPALMDILPMYAVFSILSPIALLAFSKGRHNFVLLISIGLWFCGQFFDPLEWFIVVTHRGTNSGFFNLLGWQILWITGLYLGFMHSVKKNNDFLQRPIYMWVAVVVVIAFFLVKHGGLSIPAAIEFFVEKNDLRILRLVNVGCQIIVFCNVIKFFNAENGIPWLRFLGQYSLQVFSYHILAVYLLAPISWRIAPMFGIIGDIAYSLIVAASLSVAAVLYRFYEMPSNNRYALIERGVYNLFQRRLWQ